jgi:hypothetical protein
MRRPEYVWGQLMLGDLGIKLDARKKYLIGLIIISAVYIIFISDLNFFYDWDTITRALWLRQGIYARDAGVTHFLISILAGTLVPLGVEPLNAFRFFTSLFMFVFVIGLHEFARRETNDEFLAFTAGLFILFNFGFTFLLTSIEDNIWMYGFLILFIYYLYLEKWAVSALFLSLSILMHIQCEVFIPWFLLYMSQKLNFSLVSENEGVMKKVSIAFSNMQTRKLLIAILFLLMPLFSAYSYLFLMRGWKLNNFVDNFIASGPAYHGDAELWFFSANRTVNDQLNYVYSGYVSTFVCRFPDFLKSMPYADYFGAFFAILASYLLFRSLSFNLKTLCAVPTFLILFFHVMVFESWSIERWDFMPFFIAYFVVVGYRIKPDEAKRSIRVIFALLVIFSFTFTFASFNSLCGFQESPLCAYGGHLGALFDNRSVAIETTLSPDDESGRYLRYQCNDSILFANAANSSINNYTSMKIYTSNSSFESISDIFPGVKWNKELIWSNNLDINLSLIQVKPKIWSSINGTNNKYSQRKDGSREITVYQSLDNKTKCAVFNDTQPTDFSENGLLKELLWVEPDSNMLKIDGKPSIYKIDGHTAMSMKTIQVDPSSGLRTNNRPDHYLTAISYPEKNVILTITCNGDGVNWDTETEMVTMFKL